ncbi:MAG TPA: tRNA epoxyqueuosine(34) reductase QueG [Trichormus sp.]
MNAGDAKSIILKTAEELGFHRAVIASLAPMEAEREHFEQWLSKGFAAGMDYLKRNPHFRTSPQLLLPQSRSAIIVSASYYTQQPAAPDALPFGRVARYAVGLDYHAVLRAKLRQLRARLETAIGRPLCGKAYTDDVALYEQGFAARHGLGFAGKNTMIIGPQLSGSYYFVAELFTDWELEPDQPYTGTCGQCFRCGSGCPTGAIVAPGQLDAGKCISYLTIENKGGIPLELRRSLGEWVFGCDVCQEVCPYNQRPPEAVWEEFQPDKGAGHFLDLVALLQIKSEEEFRARFAHSPLRRPKRRGLLRNALVVLGNHLAGTTTYAMSEAQEIAVLRAIESLIFDEPDDMLREHAIWAVEQSKQSAAATILQCVKSESRCLLSATDSKGFLAD